MKKFFTAIWDFLEAWGEFKYQQAKRRDFRY
jgi:hypothetical protein